MYLQCLKTFSALEQQVVGSLDSMVDPNTCSWIRASPAYREWLSSMNDCMLKVVGQPGAGVSTVASCLITFLQQDMPGRIVVHFSFDRRNPSQCSTIALFSSLTQQLLLADPSAFSRFRYLYKITMDQLAWSLESVWALFRSLLLIPRQRPVVCVVENSRNYDAAKNHFFDDFLSSAAASGGRIKILLADTEEVAGAVSRLTIDLNYRAEHRHQVKKFVTRKLAGLVENDPSFLDENGITEKRIREKMLQPRTTFLTAALALKSLENLDTRSTPSSIDAAIESIPCTLSDVYRHFLLAKIIRDGSTWLRDAMRLLVFAVRPLRTAELSAAICIAWKEKRLELHDDIPRNLPKDLGRVFGDLINIENDQVVLAHDSLQKLLYDSRSDWDIPDEVGNSGHARIARMCIEYLLHIKIRNANRSRFLTYAGRYWARHYQLADSATLRSKALQLLNDKGSMKMSLWAQWENGYQASFPATDFTHPLLIAAKLGLRDIVLAELGEGNCDTAAELTVLDLASARGDEKIVRHLVKRLSPAKASWRGLHAAAQRGNLNIVDIFLKSGAKADVLDDTGATPLLFAARSGYKDIVQILLDAGSDINATDKSGRTALHISAEYGHDSLVRMLLKRNAKIGAVDSESSTPLHLATKAAQLNVIDTLISKGAATGAKDISSSTPLHIAAEQGLVDILALLRNQMDETTIDGKTALHLAVEKGHCLTVNELLCQGARLEAGSKSAAGTPLHLASLKGFSHIIDILLDHRANTNAKTAKERTPLHLAAENGHERVIEQLLTAGGKPTVKDWMGETPLHLAASGGHCGTIEKLIKSAKPLVHMADNYGRTPLHSAAHRGILESVKILIVAGAVIDAVADQGSPLHVAIKNANIEASEFLVEQGASTEISDQFGRRPLHVAAETGYAAIVRSLVEHAEVDSADNHDVTPLMLATGQGSREVAQDLLDHGADVMASSSHGTPLHFAAKNGHSGIVHLLLERSHVPHKFSVRARDSNGRIPLHLAAQNGHTETIMELLYAKGHRQIRMVDIYDRTPLHYAIENDHVEVVRQLLDRGADVTCADSGGLTPLHLAAGAGNMEIAYMILLEKDVDQYTKDNSGYTPLHRATEAGHIEMVRLLCDKGADIHPVTNDRYSLLHLAAMGGELELVKRFINMGLDTNTMTNDNRTPISLAAENGHVEILIELVGVGALTPRTETAEYRGPLSFAAQAGHTAITERLLGFGVHPDENIDTSNARSIDTPLMYAAQHGHAEMTGLLLAAGADLNFSNQDGETPLYWAVRNGQVDMVREFLETGVDVDASEEWPGMYTAAYYGQGDVVRLFLERKVNVEKCGPNQWTPLHAAYDSPEVSRILLVGGAEVDTGNQEGQTPLVLAAFYEITDTITVLLNHEADPLHQESCGCTPLHYLVADEHVDVVRKMLKSAKESPDIKNDGGYTPLWLAVENGSVKIVELMLSHCELDVNQQNGDKALLHVAVEIENAEIIELLLERNADIRDQGPQLLRIVSAGGQVDLVKMLLDKGVDPMQTDGFGWTPELHARAAGQKEVMSILEENRRSELPYPSPPTRLSETDKSDYCELEDGLVVRFAHDGDRCML